MEDRDLKPGVESFASLMIHSRLMDRKYKKPGVVRVLGAREKLRRAWGTRRLVGWGVSGVKAHARRAMRGRTSHRRRSVFR